MHPTAEGALAPPPRSAKPRARGLTSVIDFGPDGFGWTGPRGVADLLACAADTIDFAKIYALNALLMPMPVVTEIVGLYRDAGVAPYTGGILFEHAYRQGEMDGLADHLGRVGIGMLEISENYITLSDDERNRHIDRFQRAGFKVIYEFGRKNPEAPFDIDALEALVSDLLSRGVAHVIVEQSEIDMLVGSAPDRLADLAARPFFQDVLIEADPYRFPKQHVEMIRTFGREVNLANVAAAQALRLEGLRRGIGRAVDYSLFAETAPR
ncbi:phosphosulfolactate synthase [Mongoliimonas terrestris]|uniref:phosphosulfolactate synthase n=1 Tax=Mongoliimonas terrestris TaxID=1709001 RepID=UPI000949A4F1|nr:phosphosulfolactate synthase [Mongoliimonas terrestris]